MKTPEQSKKEPFRIKRSDPKASRSPIIFDYSEVERLAGLGISQAKIALALGCSERTINNRLNNDDEFAAAYARGRAMREVEVADKLAENCNNGDTSAIKFWLQSVAGWRERQDVTMQSEVKAQHSINISAMSEDELLAELKRLEEQ